MPPEHLIKEVDHLRQLYDYNMQAWPNCISLLYPFTAVENLPVAAELIQGVVREKNKKVKGHKGDQIGFFLRLDQVKRYEGRKNEGRVFFQCGNDPYPDDVDFWMDEDDDGYEDLPSGTRKLCIIRDALAKFFEPSHNIKSHTPHLNLGQEGGRWGPKTKTGLMDLAQRLQPIEWNVTELTLLYRVKSPDSWGAHNPISKNQLKVWGTINLMTGEVTKTAPDVPASPDSGMQGTAKLCVGPVDTEFLPTSETKLRPALDVIHRIKWDPNFDAKDYGVEFSDAYHRTRCRTVSAWKEDVTHDMFIPQHRILNIFGPDHKPVWDRKRRLDLMFGSGTAMASRRLDDIEITPKVFDSDDSDDE